MPLDHELENDDVDSSESESNVSRRKMLWIAPAIMTRRLIYASAGCGKGSPFVTGCQIHPAGGS